MVPFANRIRHGRFTFAGQPITLAVDRTAGQHSLHGFGWQRPWQVAGLLGATVDLVCDHGGSDGWPWAWRARQEFALDEAGLTITLSLTNHSAEPMPAGLGLHPWFRRWRDSRARFTARAMLLNGVDLLPSGELADAAHFGDWAGGQEVPRHTIDNCFADWDGTVRIDDGLGRITMTAQGADHLHVYATGNGRDLCFEPVNHLPDAVNRPAWPMPVLAAGATSRLSLRIEEQ